MSADLLLTLLGWVMAAAFALLFWRAHQERDQLRMSLAQTLAQTAETRVRLEQLESLKVEMAAAEAAREKMAVELSAEKAQLAERTRAMAEKEAAIEGLRNQMAEQFQTMADDALRRSQASFLSLANETFEKSKASTTGDLKTLVEPMAAVFGEFKAKVDALNKTQAEDRAGLVEQMRALQEGIGKSVETTQRLVFALRANPKTRGRWGEEQLRNILELSGLSQHVDFFEQKSIEAEGGRLIPDVQVRLPGRGLIVVDSKVALDAFLEAADAPDDATREALLLNHAKALRTHVNQLASKGYARSLEDSPDFVVMFVPGEAFYFAALERDPELYAFALERSVIIVTPATLMALLKAVAFGWRQEEATKNAKIVADLGRELYNRMQKLGEQVQKLGRSIGGSVDQYNSFVGTLEGSVLPQARKFRDLGAVDNTDDLPEVAPRSELPRALKGADLTLPSLEPTLPGLAGPAAELPVPSPPASSGGGSKRRL